jgi:methionine sulfoxide reductase heme-binding subunit
MMPGSTTTVSPAAPTPMRQRATLGTGRSLTRRLLVHHLPLAAASLLGLVVLTRLAPSHGPFSVSQLASPTGDVALVLLAVTLLVGPANLLLGRRNPVNSYLRRDVGIWTALWSAVHVILGFQGHSASTFGFVRYFVADGRPLTTSFGLGNWTGLAATVLVVLLLTLSTDRSLRELKATRWKDLQRLNYTLFALVVAHAVFYGALRRTASPFTRVLVVTVLVVLAGQTMGIWLWRRRTTPANSEADG